MGGVPKLRPLQGIAYLDLRGVAGMKGPLVHLGKVFPRKHALFDWLDLVWAITVGMMLTILLDEAIKYFLS
jgi:hypothetical protein